MMAWETFTSNSGSSNYQENQRRFSKNPHSHSPPPPALNLSSEYNPLLPDPNPLNLSNSSTSTHSNSTGSPPSSGPTTMSSMSRPNGRLHHSNPNNLSPIHHHYQQPGTQTYNNLGYPPSSSPQYSAPVGTLPPHYRQTGSPNEEYEPSSCLVRTPSGNVFIPSDSNKTSTLDFKQNLTSSAIHSPVKSDSAKIMDGYNTPFTPGIPVMSLRNNLRQSGSAPSNASLRGVNGGTGGITGQRRMGCGNQGRGPGCSWRCTAVIFICISLVLSGFLIYVLATSMLPLASTGKCAVLVGDTSVSDDSSSVSRVTSREHQIRPDQTIPPDGTTFKRVELGERLHQNIPPYGYWNMQFYQGESAYVKFDIGIPRGASVGIYGRRNALPTHTSYDFLQVFSGYKIVNGPSRPSRSSAVPTQQQSVTRYLEQGHWFLSLYNDDGERQEINLMGLVSSEYTEGCPKGCNNKGDCILGSCQCYAGYTGDDCTQMECPVLCSGQGEYLEGKCVCLPGWKGIECNLRFDECEVSDCNGHGHCVEGKCHCASGFKGEFCQEVECPHPTCSGHGWCVNGSCICQKGWRSADCSRMDDAALQCLPDCSLHGHFDLESQECVCEPQWSGSECDKRVCGLDCGPHGRCEGGQCLCSEGWTGEKCDLMTCDQRCEEHGQCKNGTCVCMTGWNGRHCTLPGCPSGCSGHGVCTLEDEDWTCYCDEEWEGLDCGTSLETDCRDGLDNDNDGLTDCEDSECCSNPSCEQSNHCYSSQDPFDILLRKQPPAVTASFFQRLRFIVEEGSLQTYAKLGAFNQSSHRRKINESRASVVRGRVISGQGSGLLGVRVSMFRPNDTGFTLTRHGGKFDLMVNGGGAVKLVFGKPPFKPYVKTVWVPWNEIVVIDTVVMTTSSIIPTPPATPCLDHDYDVLKPVVLATWKHGFQGGCPERSAILTESQVVQESLPIPGTDLHLVYHSSRSVGYESTIQLQLTPSEIPESLRLIHLRITIEGIFFEKTFEADAGIKFTYAWDRLNVYRQRVYGVTWAVVRVGYAYSNCDQIIWDVQTTQVSGHEMSISDIGGWDLSIHHRYNFHEGILQKGDGRNIYLKQKPRILQTLLGDGRQREVGCNSCEGDTSDQRLLTPADLTAAPDGSLYVADFNLIRRIMPDKTVRTVVKLNETRVSYRYHLAVSPASGSVYISDPEAHQILKVKNPNDFSKPEENYVPFIGSGKRCLPGDDMGCGDGGKARDAKLQYPKGMSVDSQEVIYFADGTNVRAVDSDGLISTVIGSHRHRSHWQPLPCSGTLPVDDISLRWPTSVAVSPLDDSLYVLDDHHVLRLTKDNRIKVVAGRPLHCPRQGSESSNDLATQVTLRSPQSLAFASNGDLYIAESDTERINRVRVIITDGRMKEYAGLESKCNCREELCSCFDESHVLATNAIFSTISAIAVTPDGVVHVMDQGNLRIRSVISSLPKPNSQRLYEIYSPESQEVYVFNRFGHHFETRSITTGRTLYSFVYNVNTSNGKLSSVIDAAGNRVSFLRDYTGQVTMVENSRQQKCRLIMSRMRRLEHMVIPSQYNVSLSYHGATGLLRSSMDSVGRAHVYTYDKYGRLLRVVTPSGQLIELEFDLSVAGAKVTVTRDGNSPVTLLINGARVTETIGHASSTTAMMSDGSVVTESPWEHHIITEAVPYPLLSSHTLANTFPVPGRQLTEIGAELVNSFEWDYFVEKNRQERVIKAGRKMIINGENLLTFKYELENESETVYNNVGMSLLNVTYDALGRPLEWKPTEPFIGIRQQYDRFGKLENWVWGKQKEDYTYDNNGRIETITYADGTKTSYNYRDELIAKPSKISVNGGGSHLLDYDDGGALSSITTPKGYKYLFQIQPSVMHNRFIFSSPLMPRHYYQLLYTDEGKLVASVLPQQAGRAVYSYGEGGRLQYLVYGDGSIEFGYHQETGLLRSVILRELGYEQRIENKYHAGLIKEQRIRFGPAVSFNEAKMRYLYDGYARPRRVEMEIGDKTVVNYETSYDISLGSLESLQELKFTKTYHNRTIVQDPRKTFVRVTNFDGFGRKIESSITVRGRLVHRSKYMYDSRGRLSAHFIWRGPGTSETSRNFSYTPMDYLQGVDGTRSWQFRYDDNGNIVTFSEDGKSVNAEYDEADRLISYDNKRINSYDSASRVLQQNDIQFSFTSRGNARYIWNKGDYLITYRHDHLGRLVARQDDKGNLTQFFYANVKLPNNPTHIHNPVTGETNVMLYDEEGHLIAIQNDRTKFWVSTDNVGSPIAVFDQSGVLVKDITRNPWGHIISDTNPTFHLYVDFHGGIRDPVTGFILYGLHMYDPVHAMWLSPRYDQIPTASENPSSIYLHRFSNNNPSNSIYEKNERPKDLSQWLKLLGTDLNSVLGSTYHDHTLKGSVNGNAPSVLKPSLSVISGLSCSTEGIMNEFATPSLVPQPEVISDDAMRPKLGGQFSSSGPVLGSGIMVSRHAGSALITLVPSRENSVVQGVARDVLNGSSLLDITLPHHRHHTLYLVKEDISLRHDDLEQLQRLSGQFNVSVHEGQHPELRVTGGSVSLVILYGSTPTAAKHRLLRHVQRRAAEHAWAAEVLRVKRGGPGLHPWSNDEKEELLRAGEVTGYSATELHPVHRFPLLADDASNVVFRHSDRRRRRSRSHLVS